MQAGGKIDAGERPVDALIRELWEELGVVIGRDSAVYLGSAVAPAANEANSVVKAELFRVDISQDVLVAAEIEEAVWLMPFAPHHLPLAPLTRDHVLPMLLAEAAMRRHEC